jgi:hypothetical protein
MSVDPPGFAPPVSNPDVRPIVAIVVLPLPQLPPVTASVNVVVVPEQILVVPEIADG